MRRLVERKLSFFTTGDEASHQHQQYSLLRDILTINFTSSERI